MKFSDYPPLDGLVDLACRNGVDVRPTLLRVLTDLYVQKPSHSTDEETQYVELALGLIDTVDDATRAAVVASLANYKPAPPVILAKLGGATAPDAYGAVTGTPIEADADASTEVAEATGSHSGSDDLADLFFTANSEERRLILLNLDAVAAVSVQLSPAPGEIITRLENAALQGNSGEFSRTLAHALGIDVNLALRVIRDASGEPIVVAAKALGMKAAVLQRILLFIDPAVGQSVRRVYGLADLFDALSREAATRMVSIWRKHAAAARPVHEPVYQDDMARDTRALTTPATQRTIRGRTIPPPLGQIVG